MSQAMASSNARAATVSAGLPATAASETAHPPDTAVVEAVTTASTSPRRSSSTASDPAPTATHRAPAGPSAATTVWVTGGAVPSRGTGGAASRTSAGHDTPLAARASVVSTRLAGPRLSAPTASASPSAAGVGTNVTSRERSPSVAGATTTSAGVVAPTRWRSSSSRSARTASALTRPATDTRRTGRSWPEADVIGSTYSAIVPNARLIHRTCS